MDECAAYKPQSVKGNRPCQAVTYNANLDASIGPNGGNCFLKDARGSGQSAADLNLVASAYVTNDNS